MGAPEYEDGAPVVGPNEAAGPASLTLPPPGGTTPDESLCVTLSFPLWYTVANSENTGKEEEGEEPHKGQHRT
jgi:hypothetical protein